MRIFTKHREDSGMEIALKDSRLYKGFVRSLRNDITCWAVSEGSYFFKIRETGTLKGNGICSQSDVTDEIC